MTIGIAASEFFCINLSTIATGLGMSESIAGVTFLAFGNGSPDVFSTFAAMSSHSGSLAVGELIGAASFITAVVAGSMAIVEPFTVARKSFVRDVGFFIVATSFSMVFLADGKLCPWECAVMVCSYICYVAFVLIGHLWLGRRRHLRETRHPVRGHSNLTGRTVTQSEEQSTGCLGDPRQSERQHLLRGNSLEEVTRLERGRTMSVREATEEDDQTSRNASLAALSQNMRISRPSGGERRYTNNPIRPSLVGALEFRAALSSYHRSPRLQPTVTDLRRYSYDLNVARRQRDRELSFNSEPDLPSNANSTIGPSGPGVLLTPSTTEQTDKSGYVGARARAVSENDAVGLHRSLKISKAKMSSQNDLLTPTMQADTDTPSQSKAHGALTRGSSPSLSLSPPASTQESRTASPTRAAPSVPSPNFLAPPPERHWGFQDDWRETSNFKTNEAQSTNARPEVPKIEIPHWDDENELPESSCDFPRFTESPALLSTQGHSRPPSLYLPERALSIPLGDSSPDDKTKDKHIGWWPYSMLPSPQIILSTLFPTLCPWKEKSAWERVLGVVAAPSVFLLTITLPVVEPAETENDAALDAALLPTNIERGPDKTSSQGLPPDSPSLLLTDYLGFSRSAISHDILASASKPPSKSLGRTHYGSLADDTVLGPAESQLNTASETCITPLGDEGCGHVPPPTGEPLDKEWNRWLLCVQFITAPLFIVLVVWANGLSDEVSLGSLWWLFLYTFLASIVVLILFLAVTNRNRPPRHHFFLSFVGFIVSIAWISTIAGEVVGVLKALGVILGISDAILGLTIFAVGNSLGDLVADITIARLGYQVMALSACFGGPMLNILLGIGIGGLYMMIRDGADWHKHHPHKRVRYQPYEIEVSSTLAISGVTLLVTLIGLLVWVPLNGWRMDRKIGWSLVGLWTTSTLCNLIIEISSGGASNV